MVSALARRAVAGSFLRIRRSGIVSRGVYRMRTSACLEKRVKGHNRLVAAIHGGRLALASPLPQYLELKDFCWCGEDMAEGIEWAREHGPEAETRIKIRSTVYR